MGDILSLLKQQLAIIPPELVKPICVGAVVIILFLLIIFFILCVLYINSRPVIPTINLLKKNNTPIKTNKEEHAKPIKMKYEELPIISGSFGEFLALKGIIKAGPIAKIFLQALDVLKNTTYDVRWRYKLPCFMIAGPENSGKSSILNFLKFERLTPVALPMWSIFKKGAIFEMPKPDISEKESALWLFISELFMFIRPRRPLDGLIVTLPADMLISDAANVENHAKDLFAKIFAFQHNINFRLPIYILITKCDVVPGFSDFAHLLNHQSKQQIFGWSNPNSINTAFSTACIEDLFRTVNAGIKRALLFFSKKETATDSVQNAVLFETYFSQLEKPIALYLNAMFQSHNPSDGLLLRGVYFVGRSKDVKISDELLEPSALAPKSYLHINLKSESAYNDELYFLQDLFSEKIFKEHNIAYPIKDDAIDMAKTVFRNKLILVATSLFISLGWFYGNYRVHDQINEYSRTFNTIKNMMVKLQRMEKQLANSDDQILLNKQTKNLLQNMPIINRFEFMSLFVPQSWFSRLHKQIADTIGLIFDSTVMRVAFIDLNMNAKNALKANEKELKQYDDRRDLFDVSSFATYKKLKEFASQITTLKKLAQEYNSIRSLEDREKIVDLTKALFKDKFDIIEEMRARSPNRKLPTPQFDLKLFKEPMENRLTEIFNEFLNEVFSDAIEKILKNICDDINKLIIASKQSNVQYGNADLARVYQKTMLLSEIMQNKNFAWRYEEHFKPVKDWANIIDTLNSSEIIGMDCVKNLLRSAEIEFQKFKEKLRVHKTEITGAIVTENLENLSQQFEIFQKELKTILELPFICTSQNSSFTTIIMDDKMLIWDVRRLKELSDFIEQYYIFAEKTPSGMRPQYFDNYKTICRKCFYPTAQAMLGNAQIFDDLPLGNARVLLEDAYKRQADNIRKCSIFLGKIAKFFNEICNEDSMKDCGFSAMIVSQGMTLLEKVDALFNLETPYSAGETVFDGWNGDNSPKFLNIEEDQALKKYLLSQFSRLKFLAKDLASPVVELLSMPSFAANLQDQTLLDKWREIIASIDDYEAQKPGNSIAALENFLSETLKQVNINSFDPQGEIKSISKNGGDFFESKRADVAKALISRADLIQYEKAAAAYKAMQVFFNEFLANKFPFGNSEEDSTLTNIEKFIEIYDQQSSNIESILQNNAKRKQINPMALDFLKSMNKLIPFLKKWVSHVKSSGTQDAFLFSITLRPSPAAEAFTSSVLERQLRVKNVNIEDNGSALFFNNDPVDMQFSWVEGADEKPYEKDLPKNLKIDQPTATFSFAGAWGMFRLIEEHKINKEIEYPNGILVQFDVPIINERNEPLISKMVLKITPQVKSGDKTAPIAWPVFPSVCPDLHTADSIVNNNGEGAGAVGEIERELRKTAGKS